MDKPINSHIQIPKAILRNFSFREYKTNENGRIVKRDVVYFLDLNRQVIQKGNIKSLGTVEGYYSAEMENYLGTYVEGPLGSLMKDAKQFHQDKISKYEIDYNIIKNFARYAFLRSGLVLNKVNKPNAVKSALGALGYNTEKTQEDLLKHPEALQGIFDNYDVNVFENNSAVDLVAPRNCIYDMRHDKSGNIIWFIPFSPRLAFVLIDKQDAPAEKGSVFTSNDDQIIRNMNRHALKCEVEANNSFIASQRKQELEELMTHLT